MIISKALLRYIRAEFEYRSYVEENFRVIPTSSSELRICCPNPACPDTKYKMYVNDDKKKFNCFRCGMSNRNADVFDFVAYTEGITRQQAIQSLAAEYRRTAPEDVLAELDREDAEEAPPTTFRDIKTIDALPLEAKALTGRTDGLEEGWDYLISRGFTPAEILATSAHFVPQKSVVITKNGKRAGDIGKRIVWPIFGGNQQLVSWMSRATLPLGPGEPKYINAPGTEFAKTVWPYVPVPTSKPHAVLVEGLIDAVAVRRSGYYSYATFGKKLSKEQLGLLQYWGVKQVTVFYDKDAFSSVVGMVEVLRPLFEKVKVVDILHWPDGQDSGFLLTNPDCGTILRTAIDHAIDVDSNEYLMWQIKGKT